MLKTRKSQSVVFLFSLHLDKMVKWYYNTK